MYLLILSELVVRMKGSMGIMYTCLLSCFHYSALDPQ